MDPDVELQRLNDAVYLAHNGNKGNRGGQVVFFHGIQVDHEQSNVNDVYLRTWLSEDGSELWPKSWLSESFPTAAIYLVRYDSRVHQDDRSGRLDMFATAESILQNLLLAEIGQTPKNPVILIGQDIGGLVIKEICLQASTGAGSDHQKKSLLLQVEGVFYFSTPHDGVDYYWDLDCQAELMKNLMVHNVATSRSREDFRRLRTEYKWRTMELGASRLGGIHVKESSGRYDVDKYCMIDASTTNICRPKDRQSSSFLLVESFIKDILYGLRNPYKPILPFKEDHNYVPLVETLDQIRSRLTNSDTQVVVLWGDAGTGKSSLAKYLALEYDLEGGSNATFWDGVFYLECGRGTRAVSVLRNILRQLNTDEGSISTEDEDRLTCLLRNNLQNLNALMIFDDVWEDDRKSLVEKIIVPSAKNVKYLLTSQQSTGWRGYDTYKIECITLSTAQEIIAKQVGFSFSDIVEADKEVVNDIIEATDRHPLALATVSLAVETNRHGEVLRSQWEYVKQRLLFYLSDSDEEATVIFGTEYPRTVWAAMMSAVQDLSTRKDDSYFRIMCVLALFDGPFPKTLPLMLVSCTWPYLTSDAKRLMKRLEDRGFVQSIVNRYSSPFSPNGMAAPMSIAVPSLKMHNLRQQFILNCAQIRHSVLENPELVKAIEKIIASFPGIDDGGASTMELSDAEDHNFAMLRTALCALYGADRVKQAAHEKLGTSRLNNPFPYYFPDTESKYRELLGILMSETAEHDIFSSNSTLLVGVQTVVWKYVIKGKIEDDSMADLISQGYDRAVLFLLTHALELRPSSMYQLQLISSIPRSLEAAAVLLIHMPSEGNEVYMFAILLLGFLAHFPGPGAGDQVIFLLQSTPGTEDAIVNGLENLVAEVNASSFFANSLMGEDIRGSYWLGATHLGGNNEAEVTLSQDSFLRRRHSKSRSTKRNCYPDQNITPVQTILMAVNLLYKLQTFGEEGAIARIEAISRPLEAITCILRQKRPDRHAFASALNVFDLLVKDEYKDNRGRSSLDFMSSGLDGIVSQVRAFRERSCVAVYALMYLSVHMSINETVRSRLLSSQGFIPMLVEVIENGSDCAHCAGPEDQFHLETHALQIFQDLVLDDATMHCLACQPNLPNVLSNLLMKPRAREIHCSAMTVLLHMGYPLPSVDSMEGRSAPRVVDANVGQLSSEDLLQFPARTNCWDSLFGMIHNNPRRTGQERALEVLVSVLEHSDSARVPVADYTVQRAVMELMPLLQEGHPDVQRLALKAVLNLPHGSTSDQRASGNSCYRHLVSMEGALETILGSAFSDHELRAPLLRFLLYFLEELQEVGASRILAISRALEFITLTHEIPLDSDVDDPIAITFCPCGWYAVPVLHSLVRFGSDDGVCSALMAIPGAVENLIRLYYNSRRSYTGYRIVLREILVAISTEEGEKLLRNKAMLDVIKYMVMSLQSKGQGVGEIASTFEFLLVCPLEHQSCVEYILSIQGSVEAVVEILVQLRKESLQVHVQQPALTPPYTETQSKRLEFLVSTVFMGASLLFLFAAQSQDARKRTVAGEGFMTLMTDLLDEEQTVETKLRIPGFLLSQLASVPDPEGANALFQHMENPLFRRRFLTAVLDDTARGQREDIRMFLGVNVLFLLSSWGGSADDALSEKIRSPVADALRETLDQLNSIDEAHHQHYLHRMTQIVQIPGILEEIAQLISSGTNMHAYQFLRHLIYMDVRKIRANAPRFLLRCIVHVVSTNVGIRTEVVSDALNLLRLCASKNKVALKYLVLILPMTLRISLRAASLDLLINYRSERSKFRGKTNFLARLRKKLHEERNVDNTDFPHSACMKIEVLQTLCNLAGRSFQFQLSIAQIVTGIHVRELHVRKTNSDTLKLVSERSVERADSEELDFDFDGGSLAEEMDRASKSSIDFELYRKRIVDNVPVDDDFTVSVG